MKKIIFSFILLLLFGFKKPLEGEYIVTIKNTENKEALALKLEKIPPQKMRPLGPGVYLIKYEKDPGLKKLSETLGKDISVQPNLPYKAQK